MKRFLSLAVLLSSLILWSACGDVFRPIIIPNPPQFPNPAAVHSVLTISDNGTVNSGVETPQVGSAMVIDVSGDTDVSQKNVGLVPVHAVQQSASVVLVANQAVPGSGQDSLSKLTYSASTIAFVASITLPSGSSPNFVATTEASQVYVSLPQYVDPVSGSVVPSVGVVNTTLNSLAAVASVGLNPVSIIETPDTKKLYVANSGTPANSSTWTISAFTAGPNASLFPRAICDPTGTVCPPPLSAQPIWLAARSDSQQVYLLESNGTLAFLTTSTTSGPDLLTETSISVPTAAYMWYDTILDRLYIPGESLIDGSLQPAVVIVDVSQTAPDILSVVSMPTLPPSSRSSSDPCASTSPGTLLTTSVTSLPDASRAYVGSYYIDSADNVCPQVTVINAANFTIKTNIAIPGFPDATNPATPYYVPVCANTRDLVGPAGSGFRLNMGFGGDSFRAYLASCDGGMVNIIQTSTDTYYFNLPAPYSARGPIPPSSESPPQNPVFLLSGP